MVNLEARISEADSQVRHPQYGIHEPEPPLRIIVGELRADGELACRNNADPGPLAIDYLEYLGDEITSRWRSLAPCRADILVLY